jgi:hypothetical protein
LIATTGVWVAALGLGVFTLRRLAGALLEPMPPELPRARSL